jgi:MoCo/4Fe-4S cofactor protein with predicted Tat translocation signal
MACKPPTPAADAANRAGEAARQFWQSLDELAGSPDFHDRVADEFPRHAESWSTSDRRRFLQLMGASLALGGMQGCSSPPPESIVPFVRAPREMTPGVPLHFATAMPGPGGALGLVVTSHMGRPTKIEGNPNHPASLGATTAQAQAEVLTLYDPDRSQTVLHRGEISTWSEFVTALRADLEALGADARVHVLSPPVTSPTLARQREAFVERFPQARWHEYEPGRSQAGALAASAALGSALTPIYRFDAADIVVSLDADFMAEGPASVRYARDYMSRRGAPLEAEGAETPAANRLYAIESGCTPTGAAADHRLPLAPSGVTAFARALAARLAVPAADAGDVNARWVNAVHVDLTAHRGRSIVLAGDRQPQEVHALALAINNALGNFGSTISLVDSLAPTAADSDSLRNVAAALSADEVDWLVVIDANPAYDAPPGLDFAAAIGKARHSVHFGLYDDETAHASEWHLPAAHFLESWSDARAYDGTASIVQPLITPLYRGKTVHDLLSALLDPVARTSYDLVRETWQQEWGEAFDLLWHRALADGVVAESAFDARTATFNTTTGGGDAGTQESDDGRFELILAPDPSIGDGRWANNGWLQELPKPLTKLTWSNAVLMAPADAQQLGITTGDVVRLERGERRIEAPACVVPGHPAGALTCHLGYGRTRAGATGSNIGFNAYALQAAPGEFILRGVALAKTNKHNELARTQKHHVIDGRNIVHSGTVAQFAEDPESILPHGHGENLSMYPDIEYPGFAWGMAIDLSKCVGCNACVTACQAENNVPIVGVGRVLSGREMHWLRIDTYYEGDVDNPEAIHQPMLCQHCEKAPCEVVCPVAATTHSDEGLNEMTYNRCIGTRYCSNNCPYKVRRFNFFDYTGGQPAVLALLQNPDVTVRSRGVMEKCTYCVQRINHARIDAKVTAVGTDAKPTIADGSLQTACQQACPSQAIVFGDINDPASRVSRMKHDPRNFGVLSELGTQPRTTYLARLRNPHPDLT